jgi:hypothetical protein
MTTKTVTAPRILSAGDMAEVTRRLNAVSRLVVSVRVEGQKRDALLSISGDSAKLDIDLTGMTIQGYAPDNADVLAGFTDVGGTLHYDSQPIGANGLTQSDLSWSPSMVVSMNGAKVRRLFLAGNTSITFTDLAKERECYLLIYGGAAPYALTWQTGMIWHEEGAGPVIMPTDGRMAVHVYCSGTAATDIWITRNGGN